jgi:SulP family sulfate permease
MTAIDATGLYALEEVAKQLHASRRALILCGAREQPAQVLKNSLFVSNGQNSGIGNVLRLEKIAYIAS